MTLWPNGYTDEPLDPPERVFHGGSGSVEISLGVQVSWNTGGDFRVLIGRLDVTDELDVGELETIQDWIDDVDDFE